MTNKCRGKMVQGDYIMGNIFHNERGRRQSKQRGIFGISEEGLRN